MAKKVKLEQGQFAENPETAMGKTDLEETEMRLKENTDVPMKDVEKMGESLIEAMSDTAEADAVEAPQEESLTDLVQAVIDSLDAEVEPEETEQAEHPMELLFPPEDFSVEADFASESMTQTSGMEELATMTPAPDAEQEEVGSELPARVAVDAVPEQKKAAPSGSSRKRATDFYALDVRELDRDLSPEQLEEWNSIYASFRSHSLLRGEVAGVEENSFSMRNRQTGETERKTVVSLVLINYRVKVLIPLTEIWLPEEERPDYVARSMIGAKIEYVVQNIDREGECAVASRRLALPKLRRLFAAVRGGHEAGELLECSVLSVGAKRLLASCGGYDVTLSQRELSWTAIPDLRERFRPGETLRARLLNYLPGENKLKISVRDVNPNPFDGAQRRHPVGSRRQAVINGKYKGGVFCRMPDGTECLCTYSNILNDSEFMLGDVVLIHIGRFDDSRKQIYGRIVTKL